MTNRRPQTGQKYIILTESKTSLTRLYSINEKSISFCLYIWAASWENLFLPYADNKGADQPAHLRNLISAFIVGCLDSIIPMLAKSKISRL